MTDLLLKVKSPKKLGGWVKDQLSLRYDCPFVRGLSNHISLMRDFNFEG